jgi:ParB family chromosome partitioning protein
MGSEDLLMCLSRQALEASCAEASVQPRSKVRETRTALVEHFATKHFVHPTGRFALPVDELLDWLRAGVATGVNGASPEDDGGSALDDPTVDRSEHDAEDVVEGETEDADLPHHDGQDEDCDQRAAA